MKNIVLFDNRNVWADLLPITYTRPIADIRIGILTIREKWEKHFPDSKFSYRTTDFLTVKYKGESDADSLFVAGNVCPSPDLVESIRQLSLGEALYKGDELIALRGSGELFSAPLTCAKQEFAGEILAIHQLYDIFMRNAEAIAADFRLITAGRTSQPLSATCTVIGPATLPDGTPSIFIEEGATAEAAIFNTTNGPIYLGKDTTVMEGSCIRAPFALCEHAQVNMGAKIYGATTLGPHCKVGGELNNVVIIGYSNKAHDGFLGNAVIGEWCNLGAGATASNLKNNYKEVRLWNYRAHRFLRTGLQFCGLIMGDHSKAGINTMFNTATVVGVGANIHGAGFPRNFIASFQEGAATSGYGHVRLSEFFGTAERVMSRRGKQLTEADRSIFSTIYDMADNVR